MAVPESLNLFEDDNITLDDNLDSCIRKSEYYDIDDFHDIMKKYNNGKNISILNLNARSLVKNINELTIILSNLPSPFSIITIEESWLNQDLEPLVQIDGYTFIPKHKTKCKEGGGIGIYVKNDIDFIERIDISSPKELDGILDYIFVEIKQTAPLKNILVGVFYRAPGNNTINTITNHFKSFLPKIVKENKTLVLTSDMNINLLKCSSHEPTAYYYDTMLCNGLIPKITVATRTTYRTSTLIDHIFTNENTPDSSFAGTITTSMTDHFFNFIFLKNSTITKHPKTVTYRAFTEKNIAKFNEKLMNSDFNQVYNNTCPNKAYDELIEKYTKIMNDTIPMKTTKFDKYKHNVNPWATKGIRNSIKHRDKLHMKIKRAKNDKQRKKLEAEYNDYRSFLQKVIKIAKRNYEKERFEKCKNDSKSIWNNINAVLGKN